MTRTINALARHHARRALTRDAAWRMFKESGDLEDMGRYRRLFARCEALRERMAVLVVMEHAAMRRAGL